MDYQKWETKIQAKMGSDNIEIDLWDTGGQERYRNFGKIHYRDANCILLVYDISKEDSLAQLERYWLQGTSGSIVEIK